MTLTEIAIYRDATCCKTDQRFLEGSPVYGEPMASAFTRTIPPISLMRRSPLEPDSFNKSHRRSSPFWFYCLLCLQPTNEIHQFLWQKHGVDTDGHQRCIRAFKNINALLGNHLL